MKYIFFFFIFFIVVSCGGGSVSTGDITINGDVSLNNNSNNNNTNETNNNPSSGSSPSTSLEVSFLYNPEDAAFKEKGFIRTKKNLPVLGFDSGKIQFTSDIPSSEQTKAQNALSAAASVFGYLDINFYGLGSNAVPYESLKASACAVFSYSNCNANNMTFLNDVVSNGTTASGSFLIGLDTEAQPAHLIYQGATPAIDQIKTIHEYVRVYQNAVLLGTTGVPAWFKEGMAQYIAQWLGRERSFVAGTFSSHMDTMWDQAYSNISFYSLEDQIVYKDLGSPLGFDNEKYGQAIWAIGYMIELASQRSGITNGSQAIFSDLITQIRSKTWTVAFTDNVGISPTAFYSSFASLLNSNDKSSRLANLVSSNISSTIVPQYNYSNLQLKGASGNSNNGGNPVASKRSAYFYNLDAGEVPSYQGAQWPYIKADSSLSITKEEGISAEVEIKNTNYVTIKSSGSLARPVYQYINDSESTVLGGSVSGWSSINFDGNPIVPRSFTNTAPIINNAATASVNENQTSATAISVTDNDFNESLFFSLSGTDGNFFNLSNSGVITFKTAPNYEVKNQYSITLSVNDGEVIVSKGLTINILNINDAPSISGLASSISYLEGSGANVLTVPASDEDAGASLSYSLSGTDAADFGISNAGVLTFNAPPVFETKNLYSITISVSDGIESINQALTVNIQNTNSPPIISGLASSVVFNENATSDVVTVNATDPDAGATVSYSLGGADAGALAISSSGVITFNSPPDYETKNSYSIIVEASDGIESSSQALTINILDQNESPVISGLVSPISFNENATSNLVTINASDEDAGDSLSYSLGGADGANLSISNSGVITFNSPPDYEAKNQYSIEVIVSDGNLSASQSITVNIQNINEGPTITNLPSIWSYEENATTNLLIMSEYASSSEQCTVLTFSLSGADASDFSISNSTACNQTNNGVITFNSSPDYETKNVYSFTVEVTDGTFSVSQALTVNIQDVEEPPLSIVQTTFNPVENQTLVGFVTVENTYGNTPSFTLGGVDSASFGINATSGRITFVSAPDFETKNQYSISVTATTSLESTTQNITVNVTNENETPIRVGPAIEYFNLSRNVSLNGGQVATMQATDPDANTTFIWTLEDYGGNNHAQYFSIDSSSGVITFNGVSYGLHNSLTVRVRVSDGVISVSDELVFELFGLDQVGNAIFGEAYFDVAGVGMDINSSGNIVAIGAPQAFSDTGSVRVYQYNSENGWELFGVQSSSPPSGAAQWGEDVNLNDSGEIMSVSSTRLLSEGSGVLQIYELKLINSVNRWIDRGSRITTNVSDSDIISDVNIDGNTIIYGTQVDYHPQVYRWNGFDYAFDFNLPYPGFASLHSISLSDDGNVFAISRTGNADASVWSYDGSSWSKKGLDMNCGTNEEISEVSLSSDGNKIIIGKPNSGSAGVVCVYTWNDPTPNFPNGNWSLKGSNLIGTSHDIGRSVDISDDGNTIAFSRNNKFIQKSSNSNSLVCVGSSNVDFPDVKVYKWENSSWTDSYTLVQDHNNDCIGHKVRLNDAGDVLAYSSPGHMGIDDDSNTTGNAGQVKIFNLN